VAHYYACKFSLNRLRIDGDIRQKAAIIAIMENVVIAIYRLRPIQSTQCWCEQTLSGRFSSLSAPLPFNLFFNTRSPLRSRSPHFPPAPLRFPLRSHALRVTDNCPLVASRGRGDSNPPWDILISQLTRRIGIHLYVLTNEAITQRDLRLRCFYCSVYCPLASLCV